MSNKVYVVGVGLTKFEKPVRREGWDYPDMARESGSAALAILQSFNDLFGNIGWTDADRVERLLTEEIPRKVAADEAYQNAKNKTTTPPTPG